MDDEVELVIQAARFGARMAERGLTPAQIEKLMQVTRPALEAAHRAVSRGADPDAISWELRPSSP